MMKSILFSFLLLACAWLLVAFLANLKPADSTAALMQKKSEQVSFNRVAIDDSLSSIFSASSEQQGRTDESVGNLKPLNSLDQLMMAINQYPAEIIEVTTLAEWLEQSQSGFEAIADLYWQTDDLALKRHLLQAMNLCRCHGKVNLAFELLKSADEQGRRKAYQWLLNDHEPKQDNQVLDELVNALTYEQNESLLAELLVNMPLPDKNLNPNLHEKLLTRAFALVNFADEQVAMPALELVARLASDEEALKVLQPQLQYGSDAMQLAALRNLKHISQPDETLMRSLNNLMFDYERPKAHRVLAVRALVAVENKLGVTAVP